MASASHLRPPITIVTRRNNPTAPHGNAEKPKLSFSEVTKARSEGRFAPIRLAARQYGQKDGKPSIAFTPAELQAGVDNLKHALVAKFSGGRPHIEEVRKTLLATWGLSGQCAIGAWDARHILILLDSEADVCKVLAHPLRKLGHALFRVFRWSKDFNTRREPSTTTAWVRLSSLPPAMYNQGYIEHIISSFGRFLAMDSKTKAFTNPSYARVCAEVDTTKEMPDEVWISTSSDDGFWQKIIYESRLLYCSKCRLHGHELANCRKAQLRRAEEQKIWEARDEFGLPKTSLQIAVPQVPGNEVKSLSLTKEVQTSNILDDQSSGWVTVQKRKDKQKAFKQAKKQHATHPQQRSCKPTDEVVHDCREQQRLTKQGDVSMSRAVVLEAGNLNNTGNSLEPAGKNHQINSPTGIGPNEKSKITQLTLTKAPQQAQVLHANQLDGPLEQNNSTDDAQEHTDDALVDPLEQNNFTDDALEKNNPNNNKPDNQLALYSSPGRDHEEDILASDSQPSQGTLEGSASIKKHKEEMQSTELEISEEIAHEISSFGNASFYCEDLGGWVGPRAFYTYLRASCEDDDKIILYAMNERVNGNRQAHQEDSDTIEESDHEVAHNSANDLGDQEVSVVPPPVPTKSRHRKKKVTRSSSRTCPKKKDTNFIW